MIALLQRVTCASVTVEGKTVAHIDEGLLVFIGIQPNDDHDKLQRMAHRVLGYRIFEDTAGRMNRSVVDIHGGVLLVPQFTLAADTRKGMRPSFSGAASPDMARRLFEDLVAEMKERWPKVSTGSFGSDMEVQLINKGPATFWLQS